jgi:ribosomal protein L35AE/L33A
LKVESFVVGEEKVSLVWRERRVGGAFIGDVCQMKGNWGAMRVKPQIISLWAVVAFLIFL